MDLETENRLAALLMEEARLLRLQAEKEGVHVYLRDPKVRGRPNSRFLTATVLGVQQANRAAEVNEMWRAREKEQELDAKLKESGRYKSRHGDKQHHAESLRVSSHSRHEKAKRNSDISCSSSKHVHPGSCSDEDSGLRDDEVEKFLHSRMKRGRGAIGSRMDEPGPFLALTSLDHDEKLLGDPNVRVKEDWEERVLGPEKPSFLKTKEWNEDGHDTIVSGADAHSSRKHSLKEKRKEHESEKKRRKEKEREEIEASQSQTEKRPMKKHLKEVVGAEAYSSHDLKEGKKKPKLSPKIM